MTAQIIEKLQDIIESGACNDIINSEEFYYQKATDIFKEFENYNDIEAINNLKSMTYQQQLDSNHHFIAIILKLVSYLDTKAKDIHLYNEYSDKRTLARAGIYQNNWIQQLLQYKIDKAKCTKTVYNALIFLIDPANEITILSENHRSMVSQMLLSRQYNPDSFVTDLKKAFKSIEVKCVNPKNINVVYSKLIYDIKDVWCNIVKGLFMPETGDAWKESVIRKFEQGDVKYTFTWWHKMPNGGKQVIDILRNTIADQGYSYSYYVKNYEATHRMKIIDICYNNEYQERVNLWKGKGVNDMPDSLENEIDGRGHTPKIIFLLSEFIKLKKPIPYGMFSFYKNGNYPTNGKIAGYSDLLLDENDEIPLTMNTEVIKLIKSKKQIILQGAPGTGKTYKTAELAVAICNPSFSKFGDRNAIMGEYNRLKRDGRISFTTFHQSMDYEEFVEGLKPVNSSNGIVFEPKGGLFKEICDRALLNTISLSKNISTELEFDDIYNQLVGTILSEMVEPLKTKTGVEIEFKPNSNNNLNFRYKKNNDKNVWSRNIVSKDRLRKLYMHFDTPAKVDAIQDINNEIRSVINGCDTSAYWAVLRYIVDNKSTTEEDAAIDIENLSDKDKESTIQNFINTPSQERDYTQDVQNYVLVIDEINRGNISKILGELITLLEADKRIGEVNELTSKLPYSQKEFGVPSNLYIIGTMNTADRSVGYIDYAIRRRFAFVSVPADIAVIESYYKDDNRQKDIATKLYNSVNKLISNEINSEFNADDLMIGHSYFMVDLTKQTDFNTDISSKLEYEIKPLLREYANDGILNLSKNNEGKYDCIEQLSIMSDQAPNEQ